MHLSQKLALAVTIFCAVAVGAPCGGTGPAVAQTRPEGEMRFAVYVTIPPAWLDPGETSPGFVTPFWVLYALHDALVKPMPGKRMAPSLAESWTESPDKLVYEFTLRQGLKFHNGDPFTAEDVKFSFERAKGAQLKEKVKEVVIVDPHKVRFVLHEPWPDFMTIYGTLASAAGWITPKNYFEKVGAEGFRKHPIGLGPYKFVSMKPGIELVMEANENYWRKVPSVKRIVFHSVPEATTRLAMLKRGEVDVAYLLEGQLGESIRNDPKLKLVFSGGIATNFLDFFDMWDPKSPWARPARAQGGEPRDRPQGAERSRYARRLQAERQHRVAEHGIRAADRAGPVRSGAGEETARRGGLSERVRRRRPLSDTALFRHRRGARRISRRGRHPDQAAHDGAGRVLLRARNQEAQRPVLLQYRHLWQRLDPYLGDRAEQRHLRLWRLAGRR